MGRQGEYRRFLRAGLLALHLEIMEAAADEEQPHHPADHDAQFSTLPTFIACYFFSLVFLVRRGGGGGGEVEYDSTVPG